MKTLNQKELEQVAGGYRWSDFRKAGDDISDAWKKARDAVHDN